MTEKPVRLYLLSFLMVRLEYVRTGCFHSSSPFHFIAHRRSVDSSPSASISSSEKYQRSQRPDPRLIFNAVLRHRLPVSLSILYAPLA